MKRLLAIVSSALFAMTATHGVATSTEVPDFWYVLPATESPNVGDDVVRGIVVPTSVTPSIKSSSRGSIISWRRLDGTTQSFVVQGVSSLSFERGPLAGTIYIPFRVHRARRLADADSPCCECITYKNMSDSVEFFACVSGCLGCTCDACICSPYPCPESPEAGMRLKASSGVGPVVTIGRGGANLEIAFESDGTMAARFGGPRLHASIDPKGVTTIEDPESITLSGAILSRASIVEDKAYFAWSSPGASVILEQPVTMAAPVVGERAIDLDPGPVRPDATVKPRMLQAERTRCSSCGTYPNHHADTERMVCAPGGTTVCYRCVSWDC